MSNIWFVGDSITYGYGCRPGYDYEYYNLTYKEGDKTWTKIIADYFKMEENDLSQVAGSNPYTLKTLITNLKNFKSGDVVVIGTSPSHGVLVPSTKYNKITSTNGLELKHLLPFPPERKKAIEDWREHHILPYEKLWDAHYIEAFKDISVELINRGVITIVWEYKLWKETEFETIITHTKGKIKDKTHFSWKGHKDFAEVIIPKIEKIKPCLI